MTINVDFKTKYKAVGVILALVMLLQVPLGVFAASYTWDDVSTKNGVYITSGGLSMPWYPGEGYVSMQNPPDFTWPYVMNATSYDFRICTNGQLTEKVFEANGITNNFINVPQTLEPGKTYYWGVRYNKADGTSGWSTGRKFRIDTLAHPFTPDDIDTVVANIPQSHPRVFATAEEDKGNYVYTLDELKAIKDTTKTGAEIYRQFYTKANRFANNPSIADDPVDMEQKKADSVARGVTEQIVACSFVALLMDDGEARDTIAKHGIDAMLKISAWNPTGLTSHKSNDQVNREIVFKTAMAYDWLYHDMTPEQRATVLNMIKTRLDLMPDYTVSLAKNPYDSHGWTILGYMGITAFSLMGEATWAEEMFRKVMPLYTAVLPPWSGQDGGWSQGTGYWKHGTNSNKEFIDIIQLSGVIDLYDKAWLRSEPNWVLYTNAYNSWGSFGDEGNTSLSQDATNTKRSLARHAFFNESALAARLGNDLGGQHTGSINNYYTAPAESLEQDEDMIYPLGYHFGDLDWVVMSSDLESEDRIQFTFKSSPYGSYNHSHSDQNAFIIQAYGEKLAVRSGYYDSYGEEHHIAITNASHSHNTITVDGAKGQGRDDFMAKGDVTQYVNHLSFDSVTGSAGDAYIGDAKELHGGAFNGKLDKFDRSVIYIRPDVFVVIDDLAATEGTTSSFEWWLNGPTSNIETSQAEKMAHIENGRAHLTARVLYPENITVSEVYDGYINPADGLEYFPEDEHEERMSRVNFATDKVESTKMVVSMSVYEDGTEEKQPTVTQTDTYIKLTYPDGTKVVVNTGDIENEYIEVDGFGFMGQAMVYNKDSVMLVNGTYLDEDYMPLVSAVNPLTAAMGMGEFVISTAKAQEVEFYFPNNYVDMENISTFTDYKGREISEDIGISVEEEGSDYVVIKIEPGDYTLIDSSYGIYTPAQLTRKDIEVQKTEDGKVAVYWDELYPRTYDIVIDNKVIENVTSPYVFDYSSAEEVQNIYLREKVKDIVGPTSGPEYVSKYDISLRDTVNFTQNGDKTRAVTRVFPDGNTDMYVAAYDEGGALTELKKADTSEGDYTSGTVTKPANGSVKAFLVADNIKPLASSAIYGTDSTELSGIWINSKPIAGFDPLKDSYTVQFEEGSVYFPYITAKTVDNSSKVDITYDFNNLMAEIRVTSAKGTERIITIDFVHPSDNIHFVSGATTEENFQTDSDVGPDAAGTVSRYSRSKVGTLSYKLDGIQKTYTQYLYTNMKGNEGLGTTGSKSLSDRAPKNLNHHEMAEIPEYLKGYDYFALPLGNFYNKFSSGDITDAAFTFTLESPAEVAILAADKFPSLVEDGFDVRTVNAQHRYMGFIIGPEDIYYNRIVGCNVELTQGGYLSDYAYCDVVANVLPIEAYSTLEDYETDAPTSDRFEFDESAKYATKNYPNMYIKDFGAGTVTIDLKDLSHKDDRIVIVVKPITPKPFEHKLN